MTKPSIDLITKSQDGVITLILVLPVPWTGSADQLKRLQARLNDYLSFALDGALRRQFPEERNSPVRIRIDANELLDATTLEFLAQVRGVAARHGIDLITAAL